jgi:hypothetical protein
MPNCHFGHLILLLKGQKAPKSGQFKNEGIHELGCFSLVALPPPHGASMGKSQRPLSS